MNERKVSGHKTDISWQINYFVWSGLVKRDMRNASVKKHDYYLSLKRSYLLLMPINTIWWLYEDIRLKISLSQLEIIQIWLIKYWSAKVDLNSSHTHNVDAMLICSHTCHHIMCGQLCNSLYISVRIFCRNLLHRIYILRHREILRPHLV